MADATATKYCPKCSQTKPVTEFSCDRSARDGLYARCKHCDSERSRKDYALNRSARRARRRAYNAAHAEELRAYFRDYYIVNAGELRARRHDYHTSNPDKIAGKKAVKQAIQQSILPSLHTQACAACGGQATDYHHHAGYAPENQLDVIALCRSCHKLAHARASAIDDSSSKTAGTAGVQLAFDFLGEQH